MRRVDGLMPTKCLEQPWEPIAVRALLTIALSTMSLSSQEVPGCLLLLLGDWTELSLWEEEGAVGSGVCQQAPGFGSVHGGAQCKAGKEAVGGVPRSV